MAPRGQSNTTTDRSPAHFQANIAVSRWFIEAERRVKSGLPLDAHEIACLLYSLDPGIFRVSTRTRFYCNYLKQGVEEYTLSRAFDTIEEARYHAQGLVQEGCEGRIEKRYEWRNLLCGREWHLDSYDPDAIDIIEHFPEV